MVVFPTYNRNVTVGCVTCFYETLAHMGYIEESDIQYPPPEGWNESQIDTESLRLIGRNETVIALLQHLPYLNHEYMILPETKPVTYLNHKWRADLAATVAKCRSEQRMRHLNLLPFMPYDVGIEPDMVVLTQGRDGVCWLIDIERGCIYTCGTHWTVERTEQDPPWLWHQPLAIEKYFDGLHELFVGLKYIPLPAVVHQRKRGSPDELEHETFGRAQEVLGVPDIFEKHGWPLNFRREECINAANKLRLQAVGQRAIRWAEQDVKYAASRDFEDDKENARKALEGLRLIMLMSGSNSVLEGDCINFPDVWVRRS